MRHRRHRRGNREQGMFNIEHRTLNAEGKQEVHALTSVATGNMEQ
jgi:hypothetical protein